MRRKYIVGGIALALILSLGGVVSAATRTVTFRVQGMTCGGCAITIEQVLKNTNGVEEARVSYERGEAWVKYDDRKLSAAKLREVINGSGYQVVTKATKGKRVGVAKPKATSCCDSVSCNTQP